MSIGSSSGKQRYAELARLLRARREELGLSRRDVTVATGLSYPYVSQLEGGYRAPSVGSARKLADALYLPVEDLVRASAGELNLAGQARGNERSTGFVPNPRYAASMPDLAPASSSAPASNVPHRRAAGAVSGATVSRTQGSGGSQEVIARTAKEVTDLVGRLPTADRLEALSRAQALVMEEIVAGEVRRRESSRPKSR